MKDAVLPEKPIVCEGEDAAVLRREVKRLEVKVSGLGSALERQEKELGDLTEEVLCFLFTITVVPMVIRILK